MEEEEEEKEEEDEEERNECYDENMVNKLSQPFLLVRAP